MNGKRILVPKIQADPLFDKMKQTSTFHFREIYNCFFEQKNFTIK